VKRYVGWRLVTAAISFVVGAAVGASGLRRGCAGAPTALPSAARLDAICAVEDGVAERAWAYIVLHHSAGRRGSAAAIDRDHRSRGWPNGLGYHFVIGNGTGSGNGEIEPGPRWRRQLDGAHCRAGGMNQRGIGICFVGDFEEDRPTAAQIGSAVALVRHLAARFAVPPERIIGHREAPGAATLCPGTHCPLPTLRAAAANRVSR
jgi:hypothetical protein